MLNEKGLEQAKDAGVEVGEFLRGLGVEGPDLLVCSPFRRAMQTQLLGFHHGFLSMGVPGLRCGGRVPWVAHDDIGEVRVLGGPTRRVTTSRTSPHVFNVRKPQLTSYPRPLSTSLSRLPTARQRARGIANT